MQKKLTYNNEKPSSYATLKRGIFLCVTVITLYAQNVGIGTPTPDASAILELSATDKGLLVPRLTTAQRNAIAAPAEGLIIYNLDTKCLEVYSDTMWVNLCQTCTSTPPPPNINGPTEICFRENYAFWGSGAPSGAIYV